MLSQEQIKNNIGDSMVSINNTFSPLVFESSFSLFLIAVMNSTKIASLSFIFSIVLNRGSLPNFTANSLNVVLDKIENTNYKKHEIFFKNLAVLYDVDVPWSELGILHHPPEFIFGLHQLVLLLFPFFFSPCLHILIEHLKRHQHTNNEGSTYGAQH